MERAPWDFTTLASSSKERETFSLKSFGWFIALIYFGLNKIKEETINLSGASDLSFN